MNNSIGVIQGRLLPKYIGRYQAHPLGYWQDEFPLAQQLGLDCIEFILDFNDAEKNPLLSAGGVDEILLVAERSGVAVKTVCADYLMEAPLHSENSEVAATSSDVLRRLIYSSSQLGATDIVIPCVDQSTLENADAVDRFVTQLSPILELAESKNINLSLETDLAPTPFNDLLNRFESNRITVNYDIGNSAALGFDPIEELEAYGARITDIHIKDRVLDGGSVVLGSGNANFDVFFNTLKSFNYRGPFLMQAYRDDEGVAIFKQQLDWIKPYLEAYARVG